MVGGLLKRLDELGITDNTIVVYGTDNGAETGTWPDGGTMPFHGEKGTTYEGGFRVPMIVRWPGVIKPGTIYNEMFSHYDLIPTFCAAGGEPDVVAKCLTGYQAGPKTFKVHLDGYNLMPFFRGEVRDAPRSEFLYWNDDGEMVAIRVKDWKVVFKAQEHEGIDVWRKEFTNLRTPKLFNLRADPFERGDTSFEYEKWFFDRAFVVVPAQALVAKWIASFKEFPVRQKPASFNLDEVMAKMAPKD
jgi:arylsulfatase